MGKSNATVAAATTKNNAANTPKFNVNYADNVVAVKGLMGRMDNNGNVVLTSTTQNIPDWNEKEDGNVELIKTSVYKFGIARAIAVLCKEPGFQGYYEELKAKRDEDATISSTNVLFKAFSEGGKGITQELSNSLVGNVQALSTRRVSNSMYNELLKNVVFDGVLIPLIDSETVTYHDGYEKVADGYEIGFDFTVRLSPVLREKLKAYIVASTVDTDSWQ